MASVQIVTDDLKREEYRVEGAIQATPAQMRRALGKAIIEVEREAKRYARSGGAFSNRSRGVLARSLGSAVIGDDAAVLTVGVAYGAIQDKGGVTPAHDIKLRFAKAFAFASGAGGFSNAARIGNSKKFARIGSSRISSALSAGRSIIGMTIVSGSKGTPGVIKHPGSRIPPTHYSRRAFESAKPQVEWILQNAGKEVIGGRA